MTYYNTTKEKDVQLQLNVNSAHNQDDAISTLFEERGMLSPSEVFKMLGEKYPITSVRRSITNLTKQNILRKTAFKAMGIYGRSEYIWEIVR